MGAVVSTEVDFDTVLALVCALFTLARIGTFLGLKPGDVRDVAGGKVGVRLSQLKDEWRRQILDPVFERLARGSGEFRPVDSPGGRSFVPSWGISPFEGQGVTLGGG